VIVILVTGQVSASPIQAGDLIVSDWGSFGGQVNRLLLVDPATGNQSVLATGDQLLGPWNLAVYPDGKIYATGGGRVVELNPFTGVQNLIATVTDSRGIALGNDGLLYVTDVGSGGSVSRILQIDPTDGSQTLLSVGRIQTDAHKRDSYQFQI
jgi:hypothetical protein